MRSQQGFADKALIAGLAAVILLSACASSGSGGGHKASPYKSTAQSDSEESGIQSRAIRTAPAALPARNESTPLSAQNTPEAIAAREAAARRARATAPAVDKSAAPGFAAFIATAAANPASQTAPAQNGALLQGSKVRVRSGAVLRARPNVSSEAAVVAEGAELELGKQISNAGGSWWYVVADSDGGWLLQSDITR